MAIRRQGWLGRTIRRLVLTAGLAAVVAARGAAAESPAPAGSPAADPAEGQGLFAAICSTCHGVDASGVAEMGKNLRSNAFIAKSSIADIVEFIRTGHPPTPQFPGGMPAGGDAAYDDAQLADIAAWLKSLQGAAK